MVTRSSPPDDEAGGASPGTERGAAGASDPPADRVTVIDVAREAGVSTATVTRALQGSPRVMPATRDKVLAAVQRLGYAPNPMAQDLRHRSRTGAVGLVTAGFTNMWQAHVAAGAEEELRAAGLNLIIASTDDDPAREPELARAMIDRRVSALLMMPDGDQREFLRPDRTFGTPVVLVGRPANGLDIDVVMTDDETAVREATSQLIDLGHRRIAALAGRPESFRAAQRLNGYRAALAARRLPCEPELVITGLTTPADSTAAVATLMASEAAPTAVIALNLGISAGALIDRMTNARTTAFIAMDESEISAGLGITAITRDPQQVGRQAARLAIERLADPSLPARTITMPCQLIRRGSGEIAPPPP